MKKLMKLMVAFAVIVGCMSTANAETPNVREGSIAIAAAGTAFTNDVSWGAETYKEIDKITFFNNTTNTATTVAYMLDIGVATQIGTSGAVSAGAGAVIYPARSAVPYAGVTNLVAYPCKTVRFITTMAAANGVASSISVSVYGK